MNMNDDQPKKELFLVEVKVIFDMAVAATSKEEAEKFAQENYEDDLRDTSYPGVDAYAVSMKKEYSTEFNGCCPSNSDDERTVDQWFAKAKKA